MKKHLRNWLGPVLFRPAGLPVGSRPAAGCGKHGAGVAFQVTAGPEMPNAARDVPQIIGTEMQQRGLSVIPMDKARSLLSSRGGSIDMAAARELGKKAGADLVLFGSFKQNGEGFALQSLLVPVNEGQAKPANFDRPSLLSLNECAAAMAGQAPACWPVPLPPPLRPAALPAPNPTIPSVAPTSCPWHRQGCSGRRAGARPAGHGPRSGPHAPLHPQGRHPLRQ